VYDLAKAHLDFRNYGADYEYLIQRVDDYYLNDKDADSVDVDVIKANIKSLVASDKQAKRLSEMLDMAASQEVSVTNIGAFILAAKRREVEVRLSTALINDAKNKAELLVEYAVLMEAEQLEEAESEGTEVFTAPNFVTLIEEKVSSEHSLRIKPLNLGKRIGGLSGGNHVLVFGPPEAGKSALAITLSCGFLEQGAPGLYIENEEPARDTIARFACHLSDMDVQSILKNPEEANARALQKGYSGLSVVGLPGGTPHQIDCLVRRYKPRWVVVNQLHNLVVRSENEASKRMVAAQALRNIAKKYNVVVISVSQGDGSSIGKAVLEIGDVYYSNVALQGAVDLMLGVGVTNELEEKGMRCISFPKNKLTGEHGHVFVHLLPHLSKMKSAG
jgi:KaiC/GvpD/RAD55 family RecA-like ATPase